VRDLKGTAKHIYVGQAKRDGRRISQSGLIDDGILCGPCDGILGEYDKFGVEFCRTFATRRAQPAPAIFRISPADTEKVVKFFASLIYRYSLSSLQEAARVNLGSFEDTFRDILFRAASCASEPATVLFRYRAWVIKEDQICLPPFKSPFVDGKLDAYSISLGGFRALVKVDSRPVPAKWLPIAINGKGEITGGYLDFETTHEFKALRSMAERMGRKPDKS
jgi:hypothetical protein